MTWREVAVGRATGGKQGPNSWWQGWGADLLLLLPWPWLSPAPISAPFYFLSPFIILKNYVISLSFHVQPVPFLKREGVNLRSKK